MILSCSFKDAFDVFVHSGTAVKVQGQLCGVNKCSSCCDVVLQRVFDRMFYTEAWIERGQGSWIIKPKSDFPLSQVSTQAGGGDPVTTAAHTCKVMKSSMNHNHLLLASHSVPHFKAALSDLLLKWSHTCFYLSLLCLTSIFTYSLVWLCWAFGRPAFGPPHAATVRTVGVWM